MSNSSVIDIGEFLIAFEAALKCVYQVSDPVTELHEAVEAFDEFQVNNHTFVADFVRVRGDMISSDREAAAFMYALVAILKMADYEFV